jgi:hypothetical protein
MQEQVIIDGRIFVPQESLESEEDKWEREVKIKEMATQRCIENIESKTKEIEKKSLRCKQCRCYCGCHPCRHTKVKIPNALRCYETQ